MTTTQYLVVVIAVYVKEKMENLRSQCNGDEKIETYRRPGS